MRIVYVTKQVNNPSVTYCSIKISDIYRTLTLTAYYVHVDKYYTCTVAKLKQLCFHTSTTTVVLTVSNSKS